MLANSHGIKHTDTQNVNRFGGELVLGGELKITLGYYVVFVSKVIRVGSFLSKSLC